MKLQTLVLAFTALISVSVISGCDSYVDGTSTEDISLVNGILQKDAVADSSSWLNCEWCTLGNGVTVRTPWVANTVSSVPNSVLEDVKPSDGWEILYSTVKINGYSSEYNYTVNNENANYLLLYNRNTGFLKGFCYLEQVGANNQGLWHLSVSGTTHLFDFTGEYASPLNGQGKHDVYVSTLSDEGLSGGFNKGWNCFEVELAYDPDSQNEILNISGVNLNKTEFDLASKLKLDAKGNIRITLTGSNSNNALMSGIVSASGAAASKFIGSVISNPTVAGLVGGFAASGVKALVSKGLNKLFPSMSGSTKYNYEDLTLTAWGTDSIKGESITPVSGNVVPLANIKLSGLKHNLGVWNLKETPKYNIEDGSLLDHLDEYSNPCAFYYNIKVVPEYQIVLNPMFGYSYHKIDMTTTTPDSGNVYTNIEQLDTDDIYGYITYPSDYMGKIIGMNAMPRATRDVKKNGVNVGVPALDWTYVRSIDSTINPWQDVSFHIVNRIHINGNDYISCKKFKPATGLVKTGARPYTWSIKELRDNGYSHQ